MQRSEYTKVHEGMDVLDPDGHKIGKCGETLGDYFNVDAGLFGTTEYYVPFSAIAAIDGNRIFLDVRKDDVETMGWDRRPETTTRSMRGDEQRTMQLREEELQARKRTVDTGSVNVGKDVVEEERTMDVPLTREEVYVDRRPVDRRPADRPMSETDSEIRVPVTEDRVEVEKEPVVYEEVGIGKRVIQEHEQVSDTVRREELRVDEEGDAEVRNRRDE